MFRFDIFYLIFLSSNKYELAYENFLIGLMSVCSYICSKSKVMINAEWSETLSFLAVIIGMPNTKKSVYVNLLKEALERAEKLSDECENKDNNALNKYTYSLDGILNHLLQHYSKNDSFILFSSKESFLDEKTNELKLVISKIYSNESKELNYYFGSTKYTIKQAKVALVSTEQTLKIIENLQLKERNNFLVRCIFCCCKSNKKYPLVTNLDESLEFDLDKLFFSLITLHQSKFIF